MKNSFKVAFCAIVTALSVVFMFLGGVLVVFAYIMPMLCGIMMSAVKKTFGTSSAWITYASTSLLSLILVNDKECMLMYIAFFGFYPIIRSGMDNIKIKPVRLFLKLIVFNSTMALSQLLLIYLFHIPFFDDGKFSAVFLVAFFVLMNMLFVIYDKLLEKLLIIYEHKLEPRISKLLK